MEKYQKVHITQHIQQGWYQYTINTGQCISCPVMGKIQELFLLGQQHITWKVSGDRYLEIIVTELIGDEWSKNIDVTVPNIKSFFQLPSGKQNT